MFGTVEMRTEFDAFFGDFGESLTASGFFTETERKDLKTPGIRENRQINVHKRVQSPEMRHRFVPRAEMEMIGVREHDFGSDGRDLLARDALYGSLRTHRHEHRGGNRPMWGL